MCFLDFFTVEKRSLLHIHWLIHSSPHQAPLLDNKMPCMSNWWANGCPAEHSKLTAKSAIRFRSPLSSKRASLPGPLPACANIMSHLKATEEQEERSTCAAAQRHVLVVSMEHRAATCTDWPLTRTWSPKLSEPKTNVKIPSFVLESFSVMSVGQRCSPLLAILGFLYEF